MSISDDFAAAQTRVKNFTRTPTPPELLELYGFYKQATVGDANGARPGMLDVKGRAKFDAWAARRGMKAEAAMRAYVELAARLAAHYG